MLCFDQNIEGGDRPGDKIEHGLCKADSYPYPGKTSQGSDEPCFIQHQAEDLGLGDANAPEDSDLSSPLNDRGCNRIDESNF